MEKSCRFLSGKPLILSFLLPLNFPTKQDRLALLTLVLFMSRFNSSRAAKYLSSASKKICQLKASLTSEQKTENDLSESSKQSGITQQQCAGRWKKTISGVICRILTLS